MSDSEFLLKKKQSDLNVYIKRSNLDFSAQKEKCPWCINYIHFVYIHDMAYLCTNCNRLVLDNGFTFVKFLNKGYGELPFWKIHN